MKKFLSLFIIFVIIACVLDAMGVTGNTFKDSEISAYVVSQDFVSRRLKCPSTAKFPSMRNIGIQHNDNGSYTIAAYVDSQNSFGAMIRTRYLCTVRNTHGSSWVCDELRFLN